jgi:predicted aspartyl protease
MMRVWLVAAAAVVAACELSGGPARVDPPADTAAGEIELRFVGTDDAAIVVPVWINGEGPFDLVLDTGATFTCVTPAVAEQLALEDQPGAVGYGAGVQSSGRVRIVRFDSVRVGAASAWSMSGCVLDLSTLDMIGASVDGLLGLNFLGEFDVRLDFVRNVVSLTAPAGG